MLLVGATIALAAQRVSHNVVKRVLEAYEERYIRDQNYQHHNHSVKLIGYKTIKIPVENIDLFEEYYSTKTYALQKISCPTSTTHMEQKCASTLPWFLRS